jgi:hypothetical protein
MKNYILNFSELNSKSDVEHLEFSSAKKRAQFIADKVIGVKPIRVFTLIVEYYENESDSDVYVFNNWNCIESVVKTRWKNFWLFEWKSYEDAYKNALDLKEVSPLCYS